MNTFLLGLSSICEVKFINVLLSGSLVMYTPSPVFIIAPPNSEANLLADILNTHPNICITPEARLFSILAPFFDTHWDKLQQYGFPQSLWQHRIGDFINSINEEFAESKGKLRWIESSPSTLDNIVFIQKLFPKALFISLTRKVEECLFICKKDKGYKVAVQFAKDWKKRSQMQSDFLQTVGKEQVLQLSFDQLLEKPEKTVSQIFDFLQEPDDKSVYNSPAMEKLKITEKKATADPILKMLLS